MNKKTGKIKKKGKTSKEIDRAIEPKMSTDNIL